MDSCGALDEMGRRSEEELGGGEALDNMHGSTAERTLPRRLNGLRGRGGVCCWLIGWLEQVETLWEKLRSPSVSEKSEVADTHKAMRQQVQEKASQELIDGQSHQALFVRAESRQRNVTLSSERATNLLLEMATRWVYAPR